MSATIAKHDLQRMIDDPMFFFESVSVQTGRGLHRFGDIMAPFQRERFEALAPSLLALARNKVPKVGKFFLDGTKGSSKDGDLALAILWLLAFTRRPLFCQIGAADKDQADELKKSAKLVLAMNHWLAQHVTVQSWSIACERTESQADIVAADIAGSHGARPDVLILNELHAIAKWEFAQNLLDNASKVPNGLVIIATNAGFTSTDAYKWREMARESDRWFFQHYNRPAPWIDAAELAEAEKRNPPARFRRLWWGEWTVGSSDALRPTDIEAAFKRKLPLIASAVPEKGWTYVGGLDLSVSRDHTAFVVVGRDPNGRYRVCSIKLWLPQSHGGKIDQEQVEEAILHANKAFGLSFIASDPYAAQYLSTRLKKQKVKFEMRHQSGRNLVEQAMMLLEQFTSQNIDCPAHTGLEYDLNHLRIEEKSYGMRLVSDRGPQGHGDIASALSIALAAAKEARTKRTFGAGASSDEDAIRYTSQQAEAKRRQKAEEEEIEVDSLSLNDFVDPDFLSNMRLRLPNVHTGTQ